MQSWFGFPNIVPFSFVSSVNLDFSLADKHFSRRCCRLGANYVITACYNAITGPDPGDCLFKKQ